MTALAHAAAAPAHGPFALAAKLLSERGVAASADRLREACGGEATPDAVAAALCDRGVRARVVEVTVRDLRYLPTPTLLALRDEQWALLRAAESGGVTLEREPGVPETMQPSDLALVFDGVALDLSDFVLDGRGLVARVAHVVRRHPREVVQLTAIMLAGVGLGLLSPPLTRWVLDRVIPDRATEALAVLAAASLALGVQRAWLGAIRERVLRHLELRMTMSISSGLLDHTLRLRFGFAQQKKLGDLLQVLSCGAGVAELATSNLLTPLFDLVTGACYLAFLAVTLPFLAAMLVVLAVVLAAGLVVCGRVTAKLQEEAIARRAATAGLLAEILGGVPTIKALGVERELGAEWLAKLVDEQSLGMRQSNVAAVSRLASDGIAQLATIALFILGGSACLEGRLTVGELSAGALYAAGFLGAVTRVAGTPGRLWSARTLLTRVNEVLDRPVDAPRPRRPPAARSLGARVRVHDVWFRHGPERAWALESFNLDVAPGEARILRSASGSGKTTLLRLLAGLYTPDRGSVLIDGRDAPLSRDRVAYVPQDARLFEGSILENLELLSHGAPRHAIFEAAVRTGLAEIVHALPMRYDTRLPSGGGTLSGGQRQLLVFTACVASSRPLVLLDEALCHLDRPTQQRLLSADFFRGRTVISVMHETWTEAQLRGH
jgi:ATP-binding cassette subfamily B protein